MPRRSSRTGRFIRAAEKHTRRARMGQKAPTTKAGMRKHVKKSRGLILRHFGG